MGRGINQLKSKIREINPNYTPTILAEIGSMDGADAKNIADFWGINDNNVYIFEAHPELYKQIERNYNYNVYHYAITDENISNIKFNCIKLHTGYNGLSSLLERADGLGVQTEEKEVPACRMDKFLKENNLKGFDIVKIDTEGCSYNVLNSFGDLIKNVSYFQVEAEVFYHWEGQKMRDSVVELMKNKNFKLVDEFGDNSQVELLFENGEKF